MSKYVCISLNIIIIINLFSSDQPNSLGTSNSQQHGNRLMINIYSFMLFKSYVVVKTNDYYVSSINCHSYIQSILTSNMFDFVQSMHTYKFTYITGDTNIGVTVGTLLVFLVWL